VPTFSNLIEKANDSKAIQEAKNAYTNYLIENNGATQKYMLYDAGGRWVALHNGAAVGVYESEGDARSAMSLYYLSTTNNGKLYIYTADKEAYFKAQLSGKHLSILGDSISTFQGVSNDSAEGLNKNAVYYSNQITREDTYWQQILTTYDMSLCANNSWSGAYVSKHKPNVSGNLDPDGTISSGMARANKLAKADGTSPDYIIVYIGVNDLIGNVSKDTFATAYKTMLNTITETYTNAKVFCLNMPNTAFGGRINKQLSESYNSTIDDAVAVHNNVYLIDLYNSEYSGTIYEVNSIDKLHPNANGMDYMTDIIIDGIKKAVLADYSK
jgi:lysophospholipase L1-like esterase